LGFYYLCYPGTYQFDTGNNAETCSKAILISNKHKWSKRNCSVEDLLLEKDSILIGAG
jgi:hypothetical protein